MPKRSDSSETASSAHADASQVDRFKELARELECDEDEAAFDEALKQVVDAKHLPKHEPKKRDSKNATRSV